MINHLEGPGDGCVISGHAGHCDQYDVIAKLAAQRFRQLKTIHSRHVDIEKYAQRRT
jgi:hypothetical protein